MASTVNIPFNFQPDAVILDTSTYTVPAGKYAKVTVIISMDAWGTIATTTSSTTNAMSFAVTNDSCNHTFDLWLDEGDVIDLTDSVASATTNTTVLGTQYSAKDSSTCTVAINSTPVAVFKCPATSNMHVSGTSGTVGGSIGVSGSVSSYMVTNEYNKVT